uniref:Myosin tail domain-containing protein n=1 Tax=Strigamia maritima TaxID=126957 RepID=T1J1P8_STRMM
MYLYEVSQYENELHAKDVHVTELRMMIESLKVQISDREQEMDALILKDNGLKQKLEDLQENSTNLQLKATESLRETLELKENNVALQEQTKGLINKNLSLEIREREMIQQMKESLQIAEDAVLEKDEAHMKIQHQQAEINRLKDALARIVDEAGFRTKHEVDKVQKMYENKISRLEDEIKSVEMKSAELRSEADRATREKSSIEINLEKLHKECERGELQQAYQQLHNRLVTTERNTNHVLLELDSNKAKMKLIQTCHDKEVHRWEVDKQHLEEKIKWLEMECETHLDGKVQLACQVEGFQAQIQELRRQVRTSHENLEKYTMSAESDKLSEVEKWKNKLTSVEEYYQKMCDEFRELLVEQQNLGLRWKCETKRATQTWNNKFSDMQLELARYKNRNSELANLLERSNKVFINLNHLKQIKISVSS